MVDFNKMFVFRTGFEMVDICLIYISAGFYYFGDYIQLKGVQITIGIVIIILTIVRIVKNIVEIRKKIKDDE